MSDILATVARLYLYPVVGPILVVITLLTAGVTHGQVQERYRNPPEPGALQGTVRDSRGVPIVGATVYLQDDRGTQSSSVRTDSMGGYRFPALHEGKYALRAEMPGYSAKETGSIVIGANQGKRIDLTLDPAKTSDPKAAPVSSPPAFYDDPQFTVAGVTDAANPGGHGSNVAMRTTETLSKETVSLGGAKPSENNATVTESAPATEASLREAAGKQHGNFDANHRLGKLLVDDAKAREAVPYLEQASRLNPTDYENAHELAVAYAASGNNQLARAGAQNLLSQPKLHGEAQAALHHLLGEVEEKLGNPLESVQEYQRAAELEPNETNLFDWGGELLMHRAFEPATEVFTKGNRLFPHSVRMLSGLGVAWYARGSYDQAFQSLCQASDLNPVDPQPYLFLGKMQSVETAHSEALVDRLGRFARLEPDNALANYYYAVSLWKGQGRANNLAQVQSLLNTAVHLDPRLAEGHLQLGIIDSEQGDFSAGISAYQKAIAVNPELEEAHYRLAEAYRRSGEEQKAQEELEVYRRISKKQESDVEKDRQEIREFVYTLRGPK